MSAQEKRVIKKYPNRRLYDTAESKYVTLKDVRRLVVDGIPFCVIDKKSEDDITRTILLQIIIEQEDEGEPLFSTEALEQIIGFYGHSVQDVAGSFLTQSLRLFQEQQRQLQSQMSDAFSANPMSAWTKHNLDMWQQMQENFFKSTGFSQTPAQRPDEDEQA
ncbi:MAG: polyhydroxyalkanoate synthesis repressor PhaR [Pseudomonadota bacterium]